MAQVVVYHKAVQRSELPLQVSSCMAVQTLILCLAIQKAVGNTALLLYIGYLREGTQQAWNTHSDNKCTYEEAGLYILIIPKVNAMKIA